VVVGRAGQWRRDIEEFPEPCRLEMDVDLIGPDVDALDQAGEGGALACSGQLGPALPDLGGAGDEPALRRQIRKLCRLVDIAGIEKPLTDSAGHELFDLPGPDTPSGRSLRLTFGDQRARDIVVVPRALLDRVGRRHAVAIAIKQHPGEQAGLASAGASVALATVAGELCLNRIPQRLIDDWRVFARMGLALVN